MTSRAPGAVAAFLAVTVLYGIAALATGAGIVDDTYIFLRYARNVLEGAGPVFNDGQRVEGFTSPLWLLVLTGVLQLGFDPPRTAVIASAIAGLVALAVLLRAAAPRPLEGTLAAAFLASNPSFAFWAWTGMDTALVALLLLLVVVSFERDIRTGRAGVGTGLFLAGAALARLDALWLVPILMLLRARRAPPGRWVMALLAPSAIALAALLLLRHAYYGAWLPNTFAAKMGVPPGALAAKGLGYLALATLTYAPLLLVLLYLARRRLTDAATSLVVPFACAAWLLAYVLVAGGDHFALFRFLVPSIAIAAIGIGRLAAQWMRSAKVKHPSIVAIAIVLANLSPAAGPQGSAARSEVGQAAAWAKTGRWCAARLPPGTIASMVVGAIPYYCDRPTIDLLGLVDRHIATRGRIYTAGPPGHQKYDTPYVLEQAPRYIFFLAAGLPARPLFATIEERERWLDDKGFALRHLTTHPETLKRYEYRAEELPDGTWVEWLELR